MSAPDIDTVLRTYIEGQDASNYVDALVLNEEEIEDDDYRIIWTNAYSGSYPPVE